MGKAASFYVEDEIVVLRSQLRLATDSVVEIRSTMLNQTPTARTNKEKTAHPMSTPFARSVYSFVKSDILRSKK